MSILHIKFTPHITFWKTVTKTVPVYNWISSSISYPSETETQEISEEEFVEEKIYPTGNPQLDQLILPGLQSDKIGFQQSGFEYFTQSEPFYYEFNLQDNLIHIWYRTSDSKPVESKALSEALEAIDPNRGGPDGWMSGDTYIVDEQLGYSSIHLIPYVSYVGALYPDQQNPGKYTEYQVDISKLPPS